MRARRGKPLRAWKPWEFRLVWLYAKAEISQAELYKGLKKPPAKDTQWIVASALAYGVRQGWIELRDGRM